MRTKEHAHDYRYFRSRPDAFERRAWLASVKARVVELRWRASSGSCAIISLPASDAETFKNDMPLGNYFESAARQSRHPKAVATGHQQSAFPIGRVNRSSALHTRSRPNYRKTKIVGRHSSDGQRLKFSLKPSWNS